MTLELLIVLASGALIAFVNGANDVSKGIATLVGSGVTDYRRAVLWGAVWTVLGGFCAAALGGAMVATFGTGLLARGVEPTISASLATLLGAASWVLFATRAGLPVSTTHAIVGSLAGSAVFAFGFGGVDWSALCAKIALPLAASPIVSFAVTVASLRLLRRRRAVGKAGDCVCAAIERATVPLAAGTPGALSFGGHFQSLPALTIETGAAETCAAERPTALRISPNRLHWLTSGSTSFSRALNDAPKMAALILAAAALAPGLGVAAPIVFALVTLGMGAGSLFAGLRVTRVLAERITPMSNGEGFFGNLVTSVLVSAGAVGGLPMSTTHVSASSIVAIGFERGDGALGRKTVRDLCLAWLVTVPAAAGLGMIASAIALGIG